MTLKAEKYGCPYCDWDSFSLGRFEFHVRSKHPDKLEEFLQRHYPEMDKTSSRLSSIMAMFALVNIFYAMYGYIQRNWVNVLIPLATFLILMYSSAIIDAKRRERSRG